MGERYIRRLAPHFDRWYALLGPRAYIGGELGIFSRPRAGSEFVQVPGLLYREESYIRRLAPRSAFLGPRVYIDPIFPSPRGWIAGQSPYREEKFGIFFQSQSISVNFFIFLQIFLIFPLIPSYFPHVLSYSFIFTSYFFILACFIFSSHFALCAKFKIF